jgi:hypothetical protein
MKIIKSEIGFRYVHFEIEDENNLYSVFKAFAPFFAMSVKGKDGIRIVDQNIIDEINKTIDNYYLTRDTTYKKDN